MVYPMSLETSTLYVFISDSANDSTVDLRDKTTQARLKFTLSSQRAALALIDNKQKTVVAKYGF